VTARSPIERLVEYKRQRGFINLPFRFRFQRRVHAHLRERRRRGCPRLQRLYPPNGVVHHFYTGEMSGEMADPGQDPRGAPILIPSGSCSTSRPTAAAPDWYPKLEYNHRGQALETHNKH